MESLSYMLSVVDRNVIMRHIPVLKTRNISQRSFFQRRSLGFSRYCVVHNYSRHIMCWI